MILFVEGLTLRTRDLERGLRSRALAAPAPREGHRVGDIVAGVFTLASLRRLGLEEER